MSARRGRENEPGRNDGALYYFGTVLVGSLVDKDVLCALIVTLVQYSLDLSDSQLVVAGPRLLAS